MKRLGLGILLCVLLLLVGAYVCIRMNFEKMTDHVAAAVSAATGRPLVLESMPDLTLFPHVGIRIGAASWGDPAHDPVHVTVKGAEVSVAFMPLLRRTIEVERVTLDAPRVMVRSVAPGSDAGASEPGEPLGAVEPAGTVGTVEPGGATPGGSPGKAAAAQDWSRVSLGSVSISNGVLVLEEAKRTTQVENAELSLSGLRNGHEGVLEFSGQVSQHARPGADAQNHFETAFSLKARFTPQQPFIIMDRCELSLEPGNLFPLRDKVQLRGQARIDPQAGAVHDLETTLLLGGSSLGLKGQAAWGEAPQADLVISHSGSLRDTLAQQGISLAMRGPDALGALDFSGRFKYADGLVMIEGLKGTLDATEFSADVRYPLSGAVEGGLTLGMIDIDQYLPPEKLPDSTPTGKTPDGKTPDGTASSGPVKDGALVTNLPPVNISLNTERLTVHGLRIDALKTKLTGAHGKYALDPLTFTFYESPVAASLGTELVPARHRVKVRMHNLHAGTLLRDLGKAGKVDGRLNIDADWTMQGMDSAAIKNSLTGPGSLTGHVKVDTSLLPREWETLVRNINTITISSINVIATADNGILSLGPVRATGNLFDLDGQGTVWLPDSRMNILMKTTLSRVTLPLVITGTFDHPSYGIDPAGLVKGVLESPDSVKALEKGVKKLVKDPKGTTKSLEKGAKKLFNKLR